MRSSHRNNPAPRSSASFTNALVTFARSPRGFAGPNFALPSGALMRWMATWSTPSLRDALAMIGSMSVIPCIPPGWLCARRGGVLVSTDTPRQRIAGG